MHSAAEPPLSQKVTCASTLWSTRLRQTLMNGADKYTAEPQERIGACTPQSASALPVLRVAHAFESFAVPRQGVKSANQSAIRDPHTLRCNCFCNIPWN